MHEHATEDRGRGKGIQPFKVDLHVHTPASHDWAGGERTAADLVQAALDKGLDGIAITDHDTGEWIDPMKDAAAQTGLTIFPGLEVNNVAGNEGIHLIVLFPLETTSSDVDRFLSTVGALSGMGDEKIRRPPTAGVVQLLDAVIDFQGIAVLAHCASSKGALGEMRGPYRTQLVRHPAVLAAESTADDFYDEDKKAKGKRVYDLLNGEDPDYQRELAVYQASDSPSDTGTGHSAEGIGKRASTFYAEGPLTLESLRQCFVDRDARIAIPPPTAQEPVERGAYILGMSVTGGFLDELKIDLHSGLTTILGAKGSGKSVLVELLRFALDQEPTQPEIRQDHDHKLASKLGLHGRVVVRVRTAEGGTLTFDREYNPDAGNPFHGLSPPPAEALRVHFLSQGEVIRIAESEAEQIKFIDSFFDFERFQTEMAQITKELTELDSDVAHRIRAWKERDAGHLKAKGLRDEIEKIDKKLKNPVFAKQRALEAKTRAFGAIEDHMDALKRVLDETYRDIELVPVPPTPDSPADQDAEVLRLEASRTSARDGVLTALANASDALSEANATIHGDAEAWREKSSSEAENLSSEIRRQGGDLAVLNQERARLAKTVAEVERAVAAAEQTAKLLAPTVKRRDDLITKLEETQDEYTRVRQERCNWFEEKSDGQIKASVARGADREQFSQALLALKKGSRLTDADIRKIADNVEPAEFVRRVLRFDLSGKPEDLDVIASPAGVSQDRAQALAEFLLDPENGPGYEALLRLQYSSPPTDRPMIEFRVDATNYSALPDLSTGQKSTALLVMTLCEGERPIVVDQPEDSLDIRSIWDDMCLRLRQSKRTRQFIFTTHNSSLAVASDSDMFLVMDATAISGKVVLEGAIDSQKVRTEVIQLLEGGEDTYFLKQRKYDIRDPYQRRRVG